MLFCVLNGSVIFAPVYTSAHTNTLFNYEKSLLVGHKL